MTKLIFMKKLILSLAVLLPLSLFASNEPIQLDGQYKYNRVETSIVRDTELVPSLNTKRFNELVADKYSCYLRGDFFYCQKFLHGVEMPTELKKDMDMLWAGRFFAFMATMNSPSLTNESESLMEWDIFDSVRFDAFPASEYHYYLLRGDTEVHKISINFASGQKWMVIQNQNSISMPVERTIRISNLKSKIFNLEVFFTK